MSININHPQDDISTSDGNPPTLGGQSPLVADNATVSANSSGNVSRWVMSTASGGTGTEDGANTWAKIGTFTLGTQNNNLASVSLLISTNSVSTDICLVDVVIYQSGGTGINAAAGAGIEVKSLAHQYGMLSHNSFKLTQASAANGSPVDLWVNKNLNYGALKVIELASSFIDANSYISYNNNAAWQSSTPSGAVNITSDWAGAGTFLPYTEGDSTAGTGTYSQRLASHQIKNGRCVGWLRVDQSAHTGTGNIIVKGLPAPHAGPSGLHSTCVVHSNTFVIGAGKQLSGLVYQGTSEIRLYAIDVAGGATAQIAMDATASFIIYFDYAV